MRNMTRIWGVGPAMANELVNKGYKKIGQVREALEYGQLPVELTPNQIVGVQFYEEFQEKMDRYVRIAFPMLDLHRSLSNGIISAGFSLFDLHVHRHEVRSISKIIEDAMRKYFPAAEITTMGSYRRGKLQCGDVDILITHKAYPKTTPLGALCELVERLKAQGHISHHLTRVDSKYFREMPSQDSDFHPNQFPPYRYSQSYMGVFQSPTVRGKHRRVDIKFYPYRERICATMYFTGNGYFNRSMRLFVKRRKQMKLDDHGLFTQPIGSHYEGKRIKVKSEKELFDYLGLVWREPHERDCFDAVRLKANNEVFLGEDMDQKEMNSDSKHAWID